MLTGADFTLHPGDRVALTGPNGAGKTTLFHLMVGLLKAQAGQVEAFGRPRIHEKDFVPAPRFGYRLESVGVLDMFPHTAHVESMAVLVRTG